MDPTHTINASREISGRRWDSYANTGAGHLREVSEGGKHVGTADAIRISPEFGGLLWRGI
jgi:hypothetical protein